MNFPHACQPRSGGKRGAAFFWPRRPRFPRLSRRAGLTGVQHHEEERTNPLLRMKPNADSPGLGPGGSGGRSVVYRPGVFMVFAFPGAVRSPERSVTGRAASPAKVRQVMEPGRVGRCPLAGFIYGFCVSPRRFHDAAAGREPREGATGDGAGASGSLFFMACVGLYLWSLGRPRRASV